MLVEQRAVIKQLSIKLGKEEGVEEQYEAAVAKVCCWDKT